MDQVHKLLERIDTYGDQMIEAQRELVAIPALGPTNQGEGEMKKALVFERWLKELGLTVLREDAPDERVPDGVRPNLWGVMPGSGGPKVWVLGHLDVVPEGDRSLWSSDPWELRVEGDLIYGRGVMDDHAALVSGFFAMKALKEEGMSPAGDVGLIAVADEETGSAYGLDHLLQKRPELFSPQDLILVPDVGEPDGSFIEVAEKSMLWLKVTVIGKQVHGSTPHKGVNALYTAARMMIAARELAQGFGATDPLFDPMVSTCEPTRKEAGVSNVNTVPGRDVFYIDCRILPGMDLDDVMSAFEQRFGAIAAEERAEVELEVVNRVQSPPATDPQSPVVRSLVRGIKQVRGLEPTVGGVGGGTVASFFRRKGLPVAVWYSCEQSVHQPDEFARVSSMIADAKVLALIYAGLA
ncbi:MAG: M20 family metallo-hydrolase [Deltaproteobacteria bacterium]|nr:M20 family metallo-hydrolase [Deltaproteobacteria bacterium]